MFTTNDKFGSFLWETGHGQDDLVALGLEPRRKDDLLRDAETTANALRSVGTERLMLACRDPYHVAAGLLGAWAAGGIAVLPSNLRPDTVREQARLAGVDLVFSDDGDIGENLSLLLKNRRSNRLLVFPKAIPRDRTVGVVFTSGSTGQSVPCSKTAGQLLGEAVFLARFLAFGSNTRVLSTAPPHHLYGLLFGVLAPLIAGAAFLRSASPLPGTIAALAQTYEATTLCAVPAHLQGVASLKPHDLLTVEKVYCSGGALDPETSLDLIRRFPFSIVEVFGSSETGGIAFRDPRTTRAWQPFEGITIAADAEGRLLLDSPFLAPYGPRPFQCADRVTLDHGVFHHIGRADDVVKIGGERVSVAEVEQRLRSVPGVHDAAILAIPTSGTRQWELWAAVVAPSLTEASIREVLSTSLPSVAIPRRIRFESALPREDSGKLARDRLLSLFGGDRDSRSNGRISQEGFR